MEFHPSCACAVVRASGASKDPLPAPSGRVVAPEAPKACVPVKAFGTPSAPCRTPRLIDLERRAKFGRASFVTASARGSDAGGSRLDHHARVERYILDPPPRPHRPIVLGIANDPHPADPIVERVVRVAVNP
jgi:hypothetical protein